MPLFTLPLRCHIRRYFRQPDAISATPAPALILLIEIFSSADYCLFLSAMIIIFAAYFAGIDAAIEDYFTVITITPMLMMIFWLRHFSFSIHLFFTRFADEIAVSSAIERLMAASFSRLFFRHYFRHFR
jgi:hypothetical protein